VSLKKKLEDNVVILIAGAFAAGVSLGWVVSENLRVNPLQTEIQSKAKNIEQLRQSTESVNLQLQKRSDERTGAQATLVKLRNENQILTIRTEHLGKELEYLNKHYIPGLIKGVAPIPEPKQQCEIVKLYEQLAVAIGEADMGTISKLYSNDFGSSPGDRDAVLRLYRSLLGAKVFFYIYQIRHNNDGTVSVDVKAFLPSGNYINSNDKLIYDGTDWKFTE